MISTSILQRAQWTLAHSLLSFVVLIAAATPMSAGEPVKYRSHGDAYYVSNRFEPRRSASYIVLTSQSAFDKVFGAAAVMGGKQHFLPEDTFKNQIVVAAIHRGKATWTYTVRSVSHEADTLTLRYQVKSTPTPTMETASPLILSLPQGPWKTVTFIENEKEVAKIKVE